MLSLSPIKLLIVLVVALLLVGPDKLPSVARQIGGAWKAFRGFTDRMEEEVRNTVPDLPSTGDIARFARSPVALLDSLARMEHDDLEPDPGAAASEDLAEEPGDGLKPDPGAPGAQAAAPGGDALLHADPVEEHARLARQQPEPTASDASSSAPAADEQGPIDPSLN